MKNRLNKEQFTSVRPELHPGSFLIAAPSLRNNLFERSVIFLLQHNDHGSFGVILNRPADAVLRTVWQKISGSDSGERFVVEGGPIGGPVFALHQDSKLAEMQMPGGVCVSANSEALAELVNQNASEYRIVFGVAAWESNQLAREIEAGNWFTLDVDPQHVFDSPDLMWENFVRQFGRMQLKNTFGIRTFPSTPWLN